MRKNSLLVAPVTLALLVGCGGSQKKDAGDHSESASTATGPCACGTAKPWKEGSICTCNDVVKAKAGWCDHCGMGMAGGQKTTCMVCAKANKMCDNCTGGKPCADCQAKMPK